MMFPVDPEKEGGPPYAVSPELYTELLTPVGECGDRRWLVYAMSITRQKRCRWAVVSNKQGTGCGTVQRQSNRHTSVSAAGFTEISVEKVPDELSHPGRAGMEFLGRWRKQ